MFQNASSRVAPRTSAWLDVIRALASQAVVLGHGHAMFFAQSVGVSAAGFLRVAAKAIAVASAFSHQAVVVFFVVSGYLVGGAVLQEITAGGLNARRYALNRLTRLLVVLLPALALTGAADAVSFLSAHGAQVAASRVPFYPAAWLQSTPWAASDLLLNASFLQTIAAPQYGTNLSLWSLSNEFWYYVLFPCILLAAFKRSAAGVLVAGAVVLLFAASGFHEPARPLMFFTYFAVWCAGALARVIPSRWHVGAAALALAVGVAIAVPLHFNIRAGLLGDGIVAAFVVAFMLLSSRLPVRAGPLRFGAGYSFSLYAVHLPLQFMLASIWLASPAAVTWVTLGEFLAFVLVVNALAVAFWYVTERNTDVVRRKLQGFAGRANMRALLRLG